MMIWSRHRNKSPFLQDIVTNSNKITRYMFRKCHIHACKAYITIPKSKNHTLKLLFEIEHTVNAIIAHSEHSY
jgi:hypothetical protein